MAKFNCIANYSQWDEDDKLVHLCSCLEDSAGQVLWDYGHQTSFIAVVELLRARFGHHGQSERFRAEIKARRRRPGETLQHLYQDVCRMVALAYPQEPGSRLSTIVARDAFLDALNDRQLYVRVLEQEPQTIEHALALACKLEAIYSSMQGDGGYSRGAEADPRSRAPNTRQVWQVTAKNCSNARSNTVTSQPEPDAQFVSELLKQVAEQSKKCC